MRPTHENSDGNVAVFALIIINVFFFSFFQRYVCNFCFLFFIFFSITFYNNTLRQRHASPRHAALQGHGLRFFYYFFNIDSFTDRLPPFFCYLKNPNGSTDYRTYRTVVERRESTGKLVTNTTFMYTVNAFAMYRQ